MIITKNKRIVSPISNTTSIDLKGEIFIVLGVVVDSEDRDIPYERICAKFNAATACPCAIKDS